MNATTIDLLNVTTGYTLRGRHTPIGKGLTGRLDAGTVTALLGTNGAGKSTLLRTLGGFQPPLEGSVSLMGKPFSAYSRRQLAQTVGVVLTPKGGYGDSLTAREAVTLGRTPYTGFFGGIAPADRAAVDRALALTGMTALAGRRLYTLSDGERQKVMIAKALAQETPVILLDEPTAYLDFPSKLEMFRLLRRLAHGEGKTIVLSTHSLTPAFQTADVLWVLHRGGAMQAGTPQALAREGALDIFFGGEGVHFDRESLTYTIGSGQRASTEYAAGTATAGEPQTYNS